MMMRNNGWNLDGVETMTMARGRRRWTAVIAVAMAAALWAPEAFAQDEGGGDAAVAEDAAAGGEAGGDAGLELEDPAERDLYWGDRRDVSVVQKRLFTKDGRLEVTAYSGVIPNDSFMTYIAVGGRVGYYFVESIGVEVSGAYSGGALQIESGLSDDLRNDEDLQASVRLLSRQNYRLNAAVTWSPFYGKFALIDAWLSNFDIYLVGGLGVVVTESPPPLSAPAGTANEVDPKPEGVLGAGIRFFVNDFTSVRLDYRQGIFEKLGGGVSTPSEISLGASFFLLGDD